MIELKMKLLPYSMKRQILYFIFIHYYLFIYIFILLYSFSFIELNMKFKHD